MKNLCDYVSLAKSGTKDAIKNIMDDLNPDMTIALSKMIDYSLGFVCTDEGIEFMTYYLFHGTQIQRNYCALYFNRRGDWPIVRLAYDKGLLDEIQAFSR